MSRESPGRANVAFVEERQDEIARLIGTGGRARVADLASRFGVSRVTIRKDLEALAEQGRVVRMHGGARAIDQSRRELAFDVRARTERHAKDVIGALAAELVTDGQCILLDASTTALHVARHLMRREVWHALTVVTNSIRVGEEMAGDPGVTVLLMGGRVRWESLSVVGPLGDDIFERVNVQQAFLGAAGFTIEKGLTDAQEDVAQIKRAMVAAAREIHAVVDHTKWGRLSSVSCCPTERLTGVITDAAAPMDMVSDLRALGVPVRIGGTE